MKAIDLVLGVLVTVALFAAAAFGGLLVWALAWCVVIGVMALAWR